jgi:MFS family permease
LRAYIQILRVNPGFGWLWLAQVVSLLGDWFSTIVLSVLVQRYSPGNEGLAVSGLLLARFVPPMLISPVAGVLVDRFDRKSLLVASNVLRAGVVLMFLLTLDNPSMLWLIYVLSIMQFILSAVFEPGQSALIPSLVDTRDLVRANTLVSITWSVMLAVGAVIGGVIAGLLGAQVALIIDAITFLVAATLILQIRVKRQPASPGSEHQDGKSFLDGLRFLRRTPEAASALLVKFGNSIGNVDTLIAIYATQLFFVGSNPESGGEIALGIMYSVFGLGAFIGPLLMNRFHNGSVAALRRFIALGLAWIVIGWVALGLAESLLIVCVALFIRAMGGSVNWTYSTVIIQRTVPDAFLGRVFSIDMAGFYLATVLSTIIHGSLIDLVGAENAQIVALGTVFASLVPLIVWMLLVRWLERRQPVQAVPAAGD